MSRKSPSSLRTIYILTRYRSQRLLNAFNAASVRHATAAKAIERGEGKVHHSKSGAAITAVVSIVMTAASFAMSRGILERLNDEFGVERAQSVPVGYGEMVAVFLALMLLQALFLNLGFTEIAKSEWDLEWLITLPITRCALIVSRIIERGIVNPALFLAVYPTLFYLFAQVGLQWWQAAPLAFVLYLPCALLLGSLLVAGDTGLRLRLGPSRLKNLQIFFRLCSIAILILVFSVPEGTPPILAWLDNVIGHAVLFSPTGLLVGLGLDQVPFLPAVALLIAEVALCGWLCYLLLKHSLRGGVSSGANSMKGSRKLVGSTRMWGWSRFFSPLVVREIRLLSRDHAYLVQTLVAPLFVVAIQLVSKKELISGGEGDVRILSAAAFFSASYSLLFSALQCLNSEGQSLWILYTFPHSLKTIVLTKMRLWFIVALFFFAIMTVYSAAQQTRVDGDFYWLFGLGLVGLPLFTLIATAIGILTFKEPSADLRQRHRLPIMYGYMLLSALFISAFFLPGYVPSVLVVIVVALASAYLWQRAVERLTTLLDPSARISLARKEKAL